MMEWKDVVEGGGGMDELWEKKQTCSMKKKGQCL